MRKWRYVGDDNVEYGGVFYDADPKLWVEDGRCRVVRVTQAPDLGRNADNEWLIEAGYIYAALDVAPAMTAHGYKTDELGDVAMCDGAAIDKHSVEYAQICQECILGYYGMECDIDTYVRIGPADKYADGRPPREPDVILRGNAKLKNYVARVLRRF